MPRPLPPDAYRRRRIAIAVTGIAALVVAVVLAVAGDSSSDRQEGAASSHRPVQRRGTDLTTQRTTSSSPAETTSTTTPTGQFQVAPGGTEAVGTGRTYRYRVEVEEGSGIDAAEFATSVDEILDDPRGWTTADGISLQRVTGDDADFTVRLSTPTTTDLLCFPLETHGRVSCGREGLAVINLTRWLDGEPDTGLDLADYRAYVISHEVGHLLGHAHEECAGPGQRATTMMQQTYSIGECTPNPWPAPDG